MSGALRNVTVTMNEAVLRKARIPAARVGRHLTQKEALVWFLSGPRLDLTDENGQAPRRDETYERSRLR